MGERVMRLEWHFKNWELGPLVHVLSVGKSESTLSEFVKVECSVHANNACP